MAPNDPELWPGAEAPRPNARDLHRPWHQRMVAGLRTLKARLTLAVIGSLFVGIGTISALSLGQVESDLLARTQAREVAQTARLAADLSQRALVLQQSLRSTAEQIDAELEGDDERLGQHLRAQPALLQQFANIFVADRSGQLRVLVDDAGPRRPQVSISDRAYFKTAIDERRPVISEPVPGRVSGEPVIVFIHPIVRGGQVTSLIGGALRLSSHSLGAALLERSPDDDVAELLAISDEAGLAIAHPTRDLLLRRLALDPRMGAAVEDWTSHGSPAEPAGVLLRQPGEIVTAAGVAGTGWIVWRAMPESTLLEPLDKARAEALRNAAMVTAVLALLTLWWVHRLLDPLRRLEERALHLFAAGQDVHTGWPAVGGEVGSLVHVLRHVGAERAHLESFTGQLLGKLNSVMSAAPLGIAFTRNQRFELVNRAWCDLVQSQELDLLGSPASKVFASPTDYALLGPLVGEAFRRGGGYVGEWRFKRRDGSTFWGQLNGQPVDPADIEAGTIWTLADVTAMRESREHLEWSASHDPLTGLANRSAFETRLQAVLGHPPAALLAIDLDRFKPINDQHGHSAGDAMLKRVAAALSAHVRAGDLVVRLGGDEFAVVLERCPPDAVHRVAAEVLRAIESAELIWNGQPLKVGASIGAAMLDVETPDIARWIAAADAACYAAKAAGRGTVRFAGSAAAGHADNTGDVARPITA